MTKPNFVFYAVAFFLICFSCSFDLFGQTQNKPQVEPSYEVVLQIMIASNAINDKSAVSSPLSNVVKSLKTNYSFSNYRVASTYVQRVANLGSVEFKSVTTEMNQDNPAPVFSDWALVGLQSLANQKGQNSIQFQSFRFGQRIPIKTANNVINYEQVGLTIQRFGLLENAPTVIGTVSASKPDELMFVILTVKPAEE